MNVFLTGAIGAGKSTMVQRLLSLYPEKPVHGFYTRKEPAGDDGLARVTLHDARSPLRTFTGGNCIATCSGDRVVVHRSVLETYGLALLSELSPGDLVVMDELGFLESDVPAFCSKVLTVLGYGCRVIGALRDCDTPFLRAVRQHPSTRLYRVTPESRDTLFEQICQDLQAAAR
jgi:nucleoside-triphosphatase